MNTPRSSVSEHAPSRIPSASSCGRPPACPPQPGFIAPAPRRRGAFTLVELLLVVGIGVLIAAFIAPAFTGMSQGGDITKAAYDVAGALQAARSYATANDTYVWVGFFEESGALASQSPAVSGTGRIVISTVASRDGTIVYSGTGSLSAIPSPLIQVYKLLKIGNMHLKTASAGDPVFPTPAGAPPANGAGPTFRTRPALSGTTGQIGDVTPAPSGTPFYYPLGVASSAAQYTFTKIIQFNPRGEAAVFASNATYPLTPIVEVGLEPTHGALLASGSNVAAVQITGVGGNVTVYRM